MESFSIELVSIASAQLFPDFTLSSLTNFLPEHLSLEGQWEVAILGRTSPSMYQDVGGNVDVFWEKNQSRLNFTIWNPVSTSPLRLLLRPWALFFMKDTTTAKTLSSWSVAMIPKRWNLPCKWRIWFAFFSTDLGHFTGSNVANDFGVMLREKRPHKLEFAYEIVRIRFHDIHGSDWVQNLWRIDGPIAALLFFHFKSQISTKYNNWTVYELSDNYQPANQITAQKVFSQYLH